MAWTRRWTRRVGVVDAQTGTNAVTTPRQKRDSGLQRIMIPPLGRSSSRAVRGGSRVGPQPGGRPRVIGHVTLLVGLSGSGNGSGRDGREVAALAGGARRGCRELVGECVGEAATGSLQDLVALVFVDAAAAEVVAGFAGR